jgi:hypothetical protein
MTGTLAVYDGSDAGDEVVAKKIFGFTNPTLGQIFEIDTPVSEGIRLTLSAAGEFSVVHADW